MIFPPSSLLAPSSNLPPNSTVLSHFSFIKSIVYISPESIWSLISMTLEKKIKIKIKGTYDPNSGTEACNMCKGRRLLPFDHAECRGCHGKGTLDGWFSSVSTCTERLFQQKASSHSNNSNLVHCFINSSCVCPCLVGSPSPPKKKNKI